MKPSHFALALLVTGCVGGIDQVDNDEDEPQPEDGVSEIAAGDAIPGCNAVTNVILYSESTNAFTLPNAFAASVDPCTQYYVYLPAVVDAQGEKTMPRASADKVRALGPNFHAMAEFHWGAWHNWIAASPGTRDWVLAGKAFRSRMIDAGYAAGDIWAINEFPTTTRTGENDVWTHERNAVKSLAEGDGTKKITGVVFLAGMGQNLENIGVYKSNVENWLQQDGWWSDMATSVKFFSYEVYADPHFNCVIGSNVGADRANLNAYLEHIPRLAAAGGSRTATAAAYLKRHYVPLVGAAWNATIGFGDNRISLSDFEKFSRLQVYATHFWASEHGYPGRRIGFAFAPKDSTVDQEQDMAAVIANSVKRSYPSTGFYNLGKLACAVDGSLAGCGCTVSGSYNHAWDTFENW